MNWLKGRKIRGFKNLKTDDLFSPFMKKKPATPTSIEPVIENVNAEVKDTYLKQFKEYVKLVINDYKTVATETLVSCKERPIKASIYGVTIGSMVGLYHTVPTYRDFSEIRKQYANELSLVGSAYNRKTEYYLDSLNKLENIGKLEYKSYVFFSLICVKDFSKDTQNYEDQCAALNSPSKYNIFNQSNKFMRFLSRVVDIGAANRFYFLDKHFIDYDIDDREWQGK